MIRVTVELVPFGIGPPEVLGVAEIANDGFKSDETRGVRGDYSVRLYDKGGRLWKTGAVVDFPRKRLLAWDLLHRALADAVGDRR